MSALSVIFMGTPDFSVPVLERLIEAGHEIVCVYSQPPRPAGRGQKERLTPVHACAQSHGLEVRTPAGFKNDDVLSEFANLEADVAVVVAYGLILPEAALSAPRFGCINIHASLLPRWRGAAPIQRAIEAGDPKSGITIMQMDEGLDTGDMLRVGEVPLLPTTTASQLHDELSDMGAALVVETLEDLGTEKIRPIAQPSNGITYASKLDKTEGRIDWAKSADEIDRQVRAFAPWPGVWFDHAGERIKVFSGSVVTTSAGKPPGTIQDDKLTIACGEGAFQINELQRPGKKRAATEDVLRGYPMDAGTRLPF